MSVLL